MLTLIIAGNGNNTLVEKARGDVLVMIIMRPLPPVNSSELVELDADEVREDANDGFLAEKEAEGVMLEDTAFQDDNFYDGNE